MSLRQRLQNNIFVVINRLAGRLAVLERQLVRLTADVEIQLAIQRQHLVRLKNRQELPDDFLLQGRAYHDLTPEKAWKLFQDPNFDFILLDVSHQDFVLPESSPPATLNISLEELADRWSEIPRSNTAILVISEDGLRSILACDFLVSKGFYQCNNVSGGWKFWPGHRLHSINDPVSA